MSLMMLCWFSLAMLLVTSFVEGTPRYEADAESRHLAGALWG
ncbi:unnamed protein product [Tenebrio molitor]|nr:unnamed protein product [Tenebrio molitor]